jgi:cellulose synthase/poly-beta-1,6-N-acetylglucosamine synthase-like glycosyltransferase
MARMRISIGIPAYNEEKNIGKLLGVLLKQETYHVRIDEIIVVSSDSTDRTDNIVEEFMRKDRRIKLIKEKVRRGKASAVNQIIRVASNDVLLLESADTLPERDTIEKLCRPFADESVGMTAARPVPVNDKRTFMGYVGSLLWTLHHIIADRNPKCGEMIAFRRVFNGVPEDIVADEAWIEWEVKRRGYRVVYVPDAIVYNKAPETVRDFLKQRRRIAYGHLDLKRRYGYVVSTSELPSLLTALANVFPLKEPKKWIYFLAFIALESISELLGYYDYYVLKKNHVVWEVCTSTKELQMGGEW